MRICHEAVNCDPIIQVISEDQNKTITVKPQFHVVTRLYSAENILKCILLIAQDSSYFKTSVVTNNFKVLYTCKIK